MKTHEEYWVEQGLTYKDNFEKFPGNVSTISSRKSSS
jgi:hypothetical protein